jgi:hypothetical protein
MIVQVNLSANKLLAVPNLQPQLPAISVFKEKVLAGITKKLHLQAIVEAALDGKLFLSCDCSYQPTSNLAAYIWTLGPYYIGRRFRSPGGRAQLSLQG